MTDRARCELLNKLTVLRDYVDSHYSALGEARAKEGCLVLDKLWEVLDRRKEGRKGANHEA